MINADEKSVPGSQSGANANQGFGAPGGKREQAAGKDANAPAPSPKLQEDAVKQPKNDGLDPQKLDKTIKSEGEMVPEEQLDEDLSVTGAPPRKDGPANSPEG